jgi:hypothetical protein
MTQRLARLLALVSGLWLLAAAPAAAQGFSDWAAVVVAGDFKAHSGKPSEVFDNARRDVSKALQGVGFQPANLRQFSVRPARYRNPRPGRSELDAIYDSLASLTETVKGGCLIYFTSHGAPEGVLVGEGVLAPGVLRQMLDQTCGKRPTVVVMSACYSGVFVPALAAPNRMILTAARRDRTSFGCGETDRYPFFDECFLGSLPGASDLVALGQAVKACVAAREVKEGVQPPSEPQLSVGAQVRPLLPLYTLHRAPAEN